MAAAAVATLTGQLLLRVAVMLRMRMWRHFPLPLLGPAAAPSLPTMLLFARWSYLGLLPRLGALFLGVLAAVAATDVRMRKLLQR